MVRNDYSSGRQATGEGGWADNKPQDHEHLGTKPYKLHCNQETMGMNPLLIANIKASLYFRNLKNSTTFEEVVDEIYENCSYITPWEHGTHSGGARSGLNSAVRGVGTQGRPTSAFVLLAKLFSLQLTGAQIRTLIEHKDSPYIRGVGFLFIRFCMKGDDLWKWMGKYVLDDEPMVVQKTDDKPITMGKFVRMLLTDHEFYGTHLPRIPAKAAGEIRAALDAVMAEAVAEGYTDDPVVDGDDGLDGAAAAVHEEGANGGAAAAVAAGGDRDVAGSSRGGRGRDDRYDDRYRDSGDRDRSRDRSDRDRSRDRSSSRYDYDRRSDRDPYDRRRDYDYDSRDRGGSSRYSDYRRRDRDGGRDYDRRSRYGDEYEDRRRREEREEEYYREKRRERSPAGRD
eukprot:m.179396 g.179396  ORF g.179396 m.179396 type:complete len:397 (-) comp14756_c0_seq1:1300-2490(-)